MSKRLFIGQMSGTSADGIDTVLVALEEQQPPELLGYLSTAYSDEVRREILDLCHGCDQELDRAGALDRQLALLFSEQVEKLLSDLKLPATAISAIGYHGQTVRHRPPSTTDQPFTLQIGDPNTIAHLTGITTVADFRRRDMAAHGEGAPLAPAFHQACFSSKDQSRGILNIGGMANITLLSPEAECIGYDTGPGNALMDYWCNKHLGEPFDRDGGWAASATADPALLQQLLAHPYFSQPHPKSTGRETFSLAWLEQQLTDHQLSAATIQATLLELTVESTFQQALALGVDALYICGGGAHNKRLMQRLNEEFSGAVSTTAELGIDPDWVEACAFAWLASRTLDKLSGNLPSVTGAKTTTILGGVYFSG